MVQFYKPFHIYHIALRAELRNRHHFECIVNTSVKASKDKNHWLLFEHNNFAHFACRLGVTLIYLEELPKTLPKCKKAILGETKEDCLAFWETKKKAERGCIYSL